MTKKLIGNGTLNVGNAVIWGSVMIASALVTKGSEGSENLVMIMVVGWLMSSMLIAKKS